MTEPKIIAIRPAIAALKSHIVSLMADRGVECNEQQIFLTHGAQQGVHLLVELLLELGNRQIIMEEFSYPGFQQIVKFFPAGNPVRRLRSPHGYGRRQG